MWTFVVELGLLVILEVLHAQNNMASLNLVRHCVVRHLNGNMGSPTVLCALGGSGVKDNPHAGSDWQTIHDNIPELAPPSNGSSVEELDVICNVGSRQRHHNHGT